MQLKKALHILPALFLMCGQYAFVPKVLAAQTAEQIAKKSMCLGCHAVDKKAVGPSFKQISERYKSNPVDLNRLSDKIKNGGVGTWGVVSMPANRANISDQEIRIVLDWILKGAPAQP
jgi:cytochrome c